MNDVKGNQSEKRNGLRCTCFSHANNRVKNKNNSLLQKPRYYQLMKYAYSTLTAAN